MGRGKTKSQRINGASLQSVIESRMNLSNLAAKMKITRQAINGYLASNKIPIARLQQMSKYLDLTEEEMIGITTLRREHQSGTIISEDQIYRELGMRLRAIRKLAGKSQEELADFTGLSRTSITNTELGRQKVSLFTIYQMADFLEIQPDQLLPLPERISGFHDKEFDKQGWVELLMELMDRVERLESQQDY